MSWLKDIISAIGSAPWWAFVIGIATLLSLAVAIIALRKGPSKKEIAQAVKDEVVPVVEKEIEEKVAKSVGEAFNHWRAVPAHERILQLASEERRRENLSKVVALAKGNKHQEAIKYLEACLVPEVDAPDRAAIYLLIGNAHLDISQLVHAEAAYRSSLAAAEEIAEPREQKEAKAPALGNLGNVYAQQGELDKALEHLQQALAIDREIGHRLGEASDLGNLGNVYADKGERDKALEHHQKALAIDREIGHRLGEANQLGNLGNVYRQQGEPEKALEHHQKALAIHREIGHRLGEASALGNLGIVYADKGERDKALEHHQKALAIHREIGHRLGEAAALGNLGLVYRQQGKLDKALEHYQQALTLFRAIGAKREIAQTERAIAAVKEAKK